MNKSFILVLLFEIPIKKIYVIVFLHNAFHSHELKLVRQIELQFNFLY